jgi:hypothetical protein
MTGRVAKRQVWNGHARIWGHQGPGDADAVGRPDSRSPDGAELEVGPRQSVQPEPLALLQLLVRLIVVQADDDAVVMAALTASRA